ncbi:MAG: FeoC-like transcriptional regulator [Legionellales bacterium]
MLYQLRDFISREGVVSTQQLTRKFHVDNSALKPMLDLWIRKGLIKQCQEQTQCASSCFKCTSQAPEYYQYLK